MACSAWLITLVGLEKREKLTDEEELGESKILWQEEHIGRQSGKNGVRQWEVGEKVRQISRQTDNQHKTKRRMCEKETRPKAEGCFFYLIFSSIFGFYNSLDVIKKIVMDWNM